MKFGSQRGLSPRWEERHQHPPELNEMIRFIRDHVRYNLWSYYFHRQQWTGQMWDGERPDWALQATAWIRRLLDSSFIWGLQWVLIDQFETKEGGES